MRQREVGLTAVLVLSVCLVTAHALQQAPGNPTLFEGARLIMGDGKAPIENSAFIVENDRFTKIGRAHV